MVSYNRWLRLLTIKGGVEDTRLEANAKAKDTKKSKAKDSPCEDRPSRDQGRTGMVKDLGHRRNCSQKKVFKKFFRRSPKKKQKVFNFFFSGDLQQKKGLQFFFSGHLQNFNNSKNSAVLEQRTGQFSRTWGFKAKDLTFEAKAKDFKMYLRGRPQGQGRLRRFHLC